MKEQTELFKGKVCVVTGSDSGAGIGLGITRQLLLKGATVYMADLAEKKLMSAAESLSEHGKRVHTERLDVTNYDAFRAFIALVEEKEPIDYIFNNAGPREKLFDH